MQKHLRSYADPSICLLQAISKGLLACSHKEIPNYWKNSYKLL